MSTLNTEKKEFIEEMGVLMDRFGLPRMGGRIMALLMMSEKPSTSINEISDELKASKASVSTAARMLENRGIIEKIGIPGDRKDYYRISQHSFQRIMEQRMGEVRQFKNLLIKGTDLIDPENPNHNMMDDLIAAYEWFEDEIQKLVPVWEEFRNKSKKKKEKK